MVITSDADLVQSNDCCREIMDCAFLFQENAFLAGMQKLKTLGLLMRSRCYVNT